MRNVCLRLFVVVCLFAAIVPAQKRAITETDLFDFVWVGDQLLIQLVILFSKFPTSNMIARRLSVQP